MPDYGCAAPTGVAFHILHQLAKIAGENAAAPTSSSEDTSAKRKHGLSAVIVAKMGPPVVILTSKTAIVRQCSLDRLSDSKLDAARHDHAAHVRSRPSNRRSHPRPSTSHSKSHAIDANVYDMPSNLIKRQSSSTTAHPRRIAIAPWILSFAHYLMILLSERSLLLSS